MADRWLPPDPVDRLIDDTLRRCARGEVPPGLADRIMASLPEQAWKGAPKNRPAVARAAVGALAGARMRGLAWAAMLLAVSGMVGVSLHRRFARSPGVAPAAMHAVATRPGPQEAALHASVMGARGERPRIKRVPKPAQAAWAPLPLTDQERLLLVVAHRRDAQALASLDRTQQDLLVAANANSFERFFWPDADDQPGQKSPYPQTPLNPGGNP